MHDAGVDADHDPGTAQHAGQRAEAVGAGEGDGVEPGGAESGDERLGAREVRRGAGDGEDGAGAGEAGGEGEPAGFGPLAQPTALARGP